MDPTHYDWHPRTSEVGGSSVWQMSKKYFAGVIYGQKSLMCQLCSLKRFPHKFTIGIIMYHSRALKSHSGLRAKLGLD